MRITYVMVIITLLLSLTHFLLASPGNFQEKYDIDFKLRPCYCTPVSGEAMLRNGPGGKVIDTLSNQSPIRIGKSRGKWVKIWYGKQYDMELCDGTAKLPLSGWINSKHIPSNTLIATNFIPEMGSGNPLLEVSRVAQDEVGSDFSVKASRDTSWELLLIRSTYRQRYNEITYSVIYTGNAKYPYALFYSGQMGEFHIDPPEVVFFGGNEAPITWYPHEGYRTWAELKEIHPDHFIIREAFGCNIKVDVRAEWIKGDFQRTYGIFPEIEKAQVSRNLKLAFYKTALGSKEMEIFEGKEKKRLVHAFPPESAISIRLLEIDFQAKAVFLQANHQIGWADLSQVIEISMDSELGKDQTCNQYSR